MSFKDYILQGAGGGGGGSTFRNTPDNLRSTDTFELLVGLGTGRIKLAPGGLQNLFIDDVPVEDGQQNPSFKNFNAMLFDGDPTILNPIKLQLGSSSGMNFVGLTLANTYDNAPGDWKTAAITTPGVDFIDLRFIVQQLYRQDKDGISGTTATIEVELRPSGSATWINPLLDVNRPAWEHNGTESGFWFGYVFYSLAAQIGNLPTGTHWRDNNPGVMPINGKTMSPYVKEIRIAVPNQGDYANKIWEVRCRLREKDYIVDGDDGENETHRTISWDSVAGVSMDPIGGTEGWRGLSYAQIYGKATDQINGIPEVKGIYDLDLYRVPPSSVWNPTTRQYTGAAWDGATTQLACTQCPAWQIKKLIEDDLSGISALAPGSTLNKWDALEASKWFSQLVPDGKGGTHPRYSANWFLEQPMAVHDLVNYLAGAVGGYAWDEGDGQWRLKVEKPETPQVIFTKENIAGEFVYQHTDVDTRFNDITAVYRNRDNRYEEDRVRVFDQADIDATGRRATTIALVGCDNRQEALRRIYIRLLTALNEKRMVTFRTNRIASTLEGFSVIGIADGDLNANTAMRTTGRIVGMNGARTQITVRDTLRLEPGVAYKAHITIPNPDYTPDTTSQPTGTTWRSPTITITRNLTNTTGQRGDIYDLYLDSALPATVPEFAVVALEAVGLPALPKQYRVLGVVPGDDGEWATVSAIEIYTPKWVESDAITEDSVNAQVSTKIVDSPIAPTTGIFQVNSFVTDAERHTTLVANWERPSGRYIDGYRVRYRYNHGPWTTVADRTQDLFIEIPDVEPGLHEFEIFTLDRRGIISVPLDTKVQLTWIFKRSDAEPAIPAPSTPPPAGWSESVYSIITGAGTLWSSLGLQVDDATTFAWQRPIDGSDRTLATAIADIADDDMLTGDEKSSRLIPTAGKLETRYQQLYARAFARGLHTSAAFTALATSRTNWLAQLSAYIPTWDDTENTTSIYTHAFEDQNFPTGWTLNNGATVVANALYTTLADANTGQYSSASRSRLIADIPNKRVYDAGRYRFTDGIRIRKDAVGKATRYVGLRLTTNSGGAANVTSDIMLDTSTGETVLGTQTVGTGVLVTSGVLDMGNEWLLYVTIASGVGDTTVSVVVLPALGLSPTGYTVAATGSVDIRPPLFANGGLIRLGRASLIGAEVTYEKDLAAAQKLLSETDAATSYQLASLLDTYTFPYASDGTQTYTQQNVALKLIDNAGQQVSGVTWGFVLLSGKMNGLSANPAVEIGLPVDGSTGYLQVLSLEENTSKVEIRAHLGSIVWPKQTILSKQFAAPPVTGGGGTPGATNTLDISTGITATTPAAYATTVGITVPSGVTTVKVAVTGDIGINSNAKFASTTVNLKLQRLIGATWTDVGTTASGSASIEDYDRLEGSLALFFNDTVTANATYQYRAIIWKTGTNAYLTATVTLST